VIDERQSSLGTMGLPRDVDPARSDECTSARFDGRKPSAYKVVDLELEMCFQLFRQLDVGPVVTEAADDA
jgi:hypothetical protein